jgi:hypothetical protein
MEPNRISELDKLVGCSTNTGLSVARRPAEISPQSPSTTHRTFRPSCTEEARLRLTQSRFPAPPSFPAPPRFPGTAMLSRAATQKHPTQQSARFPSPPRFPEPP